MLDTLIGFGTGRNFTFTLMYNVEHLYFDIKKLQYTQIKYTVIIMEELGKNLRRRSTVLLRPICSVTIKLLSNFRCSSVQPYALCVTHMVFSSICRHQRHPNFFFFILLLMATGRLQVYHQSNFTTPAEYSKLEGTNNCMLRL